MTTTEGWDGGRTRGHSLHAALGTVVVLVSERAVHDLALEHDVVEYEVVDRVGEVTQDYLRRMQQQLMPRTQSSIQVTEGDEEDTEDWETITAACKFLSG